MASFFETLFGKTKENPILNARIDEDETKTEVETIENNIEHFLRAETTLDDGESVKLGFNLYGEKKTNFLKKKKCIR